MIKDTTPVIIIRGTTPTLTFNLPFEVSTLEMGFIVIQQGGSTVIEKEFSDCVCSGTSVAAQFTQNETLKLCSHCNAEVSLVVKTLVGERLETENPIEVVVYNTSKDGVI